jgi:hypothetical protein
MMDGENSVPALRGANAQKPVSSYAKCSKSWQWRLTEPPLIAITV